MLRLAEGQQGKREKGDGGGDTGLGGKGLCFVSER